MAFTKSSGLGFDLSVFTGPLTQLATTAAETYSKIATQQAQTKIAQAQAAIAAAQERAQAAAGMTVPSGAGRPTTGTNWPLYLGIGGIVIVGAVLILKKKKR